jgi:predicted nucleic acid-binding protein
MALDQKIPLVCLDEAAGRRIARLCGLKLTGSLGILIRAQQRGFPINLAEAIQRMKNHGIWLSDRVIAFAMALSGENT